MDVVEPRVLRLVRAALGSPAHLRGMSASFDRRTGVCGAVAHCRVAGRERGRDLTSAPGAAGLHAASSRRCRAAGSTVWHL